MIGPSGNVRVYLACGVTDMRRGIDGLSALVETVVKEAPGSGAIFGFRGKRADRIKLLWWDGQGFCLFYKILERGYFPWPTAKARCVAAARLFANCRVWPEWKRPQIGFPNIQSSASGGFAICWLSISQRHRPGSCHCRDLDSA